MAITIKTKKHNGIPILAVSGRLISVDSEKFLELLLIIDAAMRASAKKIPKIQLLTFQKLILLTALGWAPLCTTIPR